MDDRARRARAAREVIAPDLPGFGATPPLAGEGEETVALIRRSTG